MSTFYLKQGNTLPAITATLVDNNNAVLNLTGATVNFHMTNYFSGNVVNATASIVSPTAGTVQYNWQSGDTAIPGVYSCEWAVVFSSGAQETYPLNGYNTVNIQPDISQGFPQLIAGSVWNTIRNGTSAPTSSQGNNGDYWVNTATDLFYGPKSNGVWPAGFSLGGAFLGSNTTSQLISSGTASTITGLSSSVVATQYIVEAFIPYSSAGTTNTPKFSFSSPAASSFGLMSVFDTAAYTAPVFNTATSATITGPTLTASSSLGLELQGTVTFSAAGTFSIQAFTSGTNFTIQAGAWLRLTLI